ncbi:hypothetical protein EDF81_3001 [Enterobacter sp. BIGb0383]|uniref:hypothetical protein n=1 Tax=unclassified Enterobacter TaxID=2608935 RepID=UPI000FA263FE|nr:MULTISPECIES: hypothetical protein [unclassified Enterobacter]ROP60165.1 hypothetical protein EDF81_3001 [Enterobacter sp. BIGb0383]ROS08369.1 hypothetical protein EC848_1834 [Enterobacter sp. BIGb0359]
MQVDLDLLEAAIATIFSDMKQRGIDSVQLDSDFYWNVPFKCIYDPYNEPSQLDIGQLEEDYEALKHAQETDKLTGYNLKNISFNNEIYISEIPILKRYPSLHKTEQGSDLPALQMMQNSPAARMPVLT